MNTTQNNVATAGQARRILEEILPQGATKETVQSIIKSGILADLTQVDWGYFDRNLFCFNNGIPAFEVSNQIEIQVDYQKPLEKYWDHFVDSVKDEVATWLTNIAFPDLSGLASVTSKYAVIKCRREMSDNWLSKSMSSGGFSHVNYIEFLSFYRKAFNTVIRHNQLWAPGKQLRYKSNFNFFLSYINRSSHGSDFIDVFNPRYLKTTFQANKGVCIIVRCSTS